MEHGEIGPFLPADKDATEAVELGVGALDHPAPRAEAGLALERLRLLAAGADVAGEGELGRELVHLGVVVALVQAEALGRGFGGVRSLDHDLFECRAEELEVVDVGARDLEPERDAAAFAEERALRPLLARSVGFGPVLAPPSGALVIAPSAASHAQSIPTTWSYSNNPCRQISWNTPACSHS